MTWNSVVVMTLLSGSLIGPLASASAQGLSGNEWSHGTTLGVSAGIATTSGTQGVLGAALGWEVNHWIELGGSGSWLAQRHGSEAFAAELTVVANLTRPNIVVPFVGAGIGMYRATFDLTAGTPPDFYRGRLTQPAADTQAIFADPSYVLAAGVDIFTGRHVSVRPELSVRLVTHSSNTYAVPMATVRATYHFERHDLAR